MKNSNLLGIININKEKGYTSHDVVAIIRGLTRTKTGHTGTLDPDATGVLPVCLGRATKLADYFAAEDKTYVAELITGITTTTGDISGEIISQKEPINDQEKIRMAAESFLYKNRGEYMQIPPMYSAIKIGGKKLYELARKGEVIERPARPIKIFDIEVTKTNDKILIQTSCSKGTYIRSLCADIGEALGCGATMGELTRTRSGSFHIENAITIDKLKTIDIHDILLPIDKLLPYPTVTVPTEALPRALNGNPLTLNISLPPTEKLWLKSPAAPYPLIGLYCVKDNTLRSEVML
ncbi:MAG: tRNA pseudouridine(55) synthase TruB [Defluviitaleaceae bacterium]|nr:tRNA pseudouridine(55) synthase TruB [Defluviitaleaceae bacterium]